LTLRPGYYLPGEKQVFKKQSGFPYFGVGLFLQGPVIVFREREIGLVSLQGKTIKGGSG